MEDIGSKVLGLRKLKLDEKEKKMCYLDLFIGFLEERNELFDLDIEINVVFLNEFMDRVVCYLKYLELD